MNLEVLETKETIETKNAIAPDGAIKLICVDNPFEPRNHAVSYPAWFDGQSLADVIPVYYDPKSHVISVDGKLIESDEVLSSVRINEKSCVVMVAVPAGDDGKDILRLVAIIALAVFAPAIVGVIAPTLTVGTTAFLAAQVGVMVVGSVLIMGLLPPSAPKIESIEQSPTFGLDGAKITAQEGIPVPVCYGGGFRMAGNLISMYTENLSNTQMLYLLINAGEGSIAGISNIELNEQPIENFQDVQWETRLGTSTQTPIPWFNKTVGLINRGITLGTTFSTYVGTTEIDQFRLDFVAPSGIVSFDSRGRQRPASVTIEVEYRIAGSSGAWTALTDQALPTSYQTRYNYYAYTTRDPFTGDGTGFIGENFSTTLGVGETLDSSGQILDSSGGIIGWVSEAPVYNEPLTISRASTSPIRWSIISPVLPEGIYEVRVRRTTVETVGNTLIDRVIWADYGEITNEIVAYKHTALLGIRIRLDDQLNSIPNVTYINSGRVIRNYSGGQWQDDAPSNNPAWVALDMLTNTRYGAQVPDSRIDMDKWKEWGEYCDSVGLTFEGAFDMKATIWDQLTHVFRCGHARPLVVGTKYSLAIEKPSPVPTQLFSVGNIIKGSFEQSWVGLAGRANEIEVNYFDKADRNKQKTIKVYDPAVAESANQNTASITLYGITTPERATEEAIFQLNMNRFIKSTISFKVPVEALACTVGDTVLVQHDQPNWTKGGRTGSGSTTTSIILDRPVDVGIGTHSLLLHFDAIQRFSGTISAIVGNQVTLSGYTNTGTVHRIQANGRDIRVTQQWANGVFLESTTGLTVGAPYSLFETDVVETRTVTSPLGVGYTTLTVGSPFSAAPASLRNWMFGLNSQVARQWRITAIDGDTSWTRTLRCIEYSQDIYDWSNINGVVVPPDPNASLTVPHVTGLSATEGRILINDSYRPVAEIYWSAPVGYDQYDGADVWVRLGTDIRTPETLAGSVYGSATSFTYEAEVGQTLVFRVVARGTQSRMALRSTAPTTSRTITGDSVAPALPSSAVLVQSPVGLTLSWLNPTDADLRGVEIRRGTTSDVNAAALVFFSDRNQTTWLDIDATNSTLSYYYFLRSVDSNGNFSGWTTPTPTNLSPSDILSGQSITGYLTNESHTVAADSSGVVASFSGAGGTFKVYEGTTDVTTSATFSVQSSTDVTISINPGTGVYSVTAMAADQGQATLRAVYSGVTLDVVYSIAKARAGAGGGINAKTLNLFWDRQSFTFDGANALAPSVQAATVGANPQNLTGGPVTWSYADNLGTASATLATFVNAIDQNTREVTSAAFTSNLSRLWFRVTATAAVADGSLTDSVTLVKLRDGATPRAGLLTNETHVVPANSAGTVTSYAGASGTFQVFFGTTDITSLCTFATTTNAAGLTNGGGGALINATTGAYNIDGGMDPGEETATVVFTATIPAIYGAGTIQKVFTLTKSRAGAAGATGAPGANARTLIVISNRQTIAYDSLGALNPSLQTVTFTAQKQNTTATVSWTIRRVDGTVLTPSNFLSNVTGDTTNMLASDFNTAIGSTQGVIVTGTIVDGATISDEISILRVQDGATGAQGPQGNPGLQGNPGATGPSGSAPFVLVNAANASFPTVNSIAKVSGTGNWDAGAHTQERYTGGAFATFRFAASAYAMAGLNSASDLTDPGYATIDYAIFAVSDGQLQIYESGVFIGSYGVYTPSDVFTVSYDGQYVRYLRNGTILRSVPVPGNLTFAFDSSMLTIQTHILDIYFGPQGNAGSEAYPLQLEGVQRIGGTLIKTVGQPDGWNAQAYSTIGYRSCFASARPGVASRATMFGLDTNPTQDNSYINIDYAWYIRQDNTVEIYESGNPAGGIGYPAYNTATNLAITYDGRRITYWLNSSPVRTVNRPGLTLYFDSSFFDNGAASITNVAFGPQGPAAPQSGNMLDLDQWVVGATVDSPLGNFIPSNSASGESVVVMGGSGGAPLGPYNTPEPLWECRPNSGGDASGGFVNEGDIFAIDPQRAYRVRCWFRKNSSMTSGNLYMGCGVSGQTYDINSGSVNNNPYFMSPGFNELESDRWYLFVGIIHGSGYVGGDSEIAGVYDPRTGRKVTIGYDVEYRMAPGATNQAIRCFPYYVTQTAARIWISRPAFELMDGREPTIGSLLVAQDSDNTDRQRIIPDVEIDNPAAWQLVTGLGAPTFSLTGGTVGGYIQFNDEGYAFPVRERGYRQLTGRQWLKVTVRAMQVTNASGGARLRVSLYSVNVPRVASGWPNGGEWGGGFADVDFPVWSQPLDTWVESTRYVYLNFANASFPYLFVGVSTTNWKSPFTAGTTRLDYIDIEPVSQPSGLALVSSVSASRDINSNDIGTVITHDSSSPAQFTIPNDTDLPAPIGAIIGILQLNTGAVSIAPGIGVTLVSPIGRTDIRTISGRYGRGGLVKTAANTWSLDGSLSP